jgi:hypothetical protein
MASPFLENLKKSVEEGDFNSEAAKKISEIEKLANKKINEIKKLEEIEESINKRLEDAGIRTINEEDIKNVNSEYNKKMSEIEEKNAVLKQIKILRDIDENIIICITELFDFIKTLEEAFNEKNMNHIELFIEINKLKNKYNNIINL